MADTLLVISCFQQLCPSIQGVAAGTSGNEVISRLACLRLCRLPLGLRLLCSLAASEFTDVTTNVTCSSWPTRKFREDTPVCHETGPLELQERNMELGAALQPTCPQGVRDTGSSSGLSGITLAQICWQLEISTVCWSDMGAFLLDRRSIVGEGRHTS